MGRLLLSMSLILASASAWAATEITPDNLVGRYKAETRVGFQRYYINFRVIDGNDFEIQRAYADGRKDEMCNGTYTLANNLYYTETGVMTAKTFRGTFTCPSDRSRKLAFNINFGNKSVEDLEKGTSVTVTTSAAPGMRLSTYVKKQ